MILIITSMLMMCCYAKIRTIFNSALFLGNENCVNAFLGCASVVLLPREYHFLLPSEE